MYASLGRLQIDILDVFKSLQKLQTDRYILLSHMISMLDSHPENADKSLKTMDRDACLANLYSIMSIPVSSVVLRQAVVLVWWQI